MPTYNPNQAEYWMTPWSQSAGGQNANAQQQAWNALMGAMNTNLGGGGGLSGVYAKARGTQTPNQLALTGMNTGMNTGLTQTNNAAQAAYDPEANIRAQQFANIYSQALKAYDPNAINSIYANAQGMLGRSQGASVAGAQRTGAMQAASGSLANPGAFVMGAGQNARAPYAEASAQLGDQQAKAVLAGQKGLMDVQYLLSQAQKGDKDAEARLDIMRQQLQMERERLARGEANPLTWLTAGADAASKFGPLFG